MPDRNFPIIFYDQAVAVYLIVIPATQFFLFFAGSSVLTWVARSERSDVC